MPEEVDNLGSWALISFGPQRQFEAARNWTGPWRVYDPTNGTISTGDIWRFNSGIKE